MLISLPLRSELRQSGSCWEEEEEEEECARAAAQSFLGDVVRGGSKLDREVYESAGAQGGHWLGMRGILDKADFFFFFFFFF